jgi:hypothetical protein
MKILDSIGKTIDNLLWETNDPTLETVLFVTFVFIVIGFLTWVVVNVR